jgi:HD-like signal output (HDOD) protein
LLEYRSSTPPHLPVYCPVLFDRGGRLLQHESWLNDPLEAGNKAAPVLEVVNLIGFVPQARRASERVAELMAAMHDSVVDKNSRRGIGLSLVGEDEVTRPQQEPGEVEAYAEVDKRADRDVTLANAYGDTLGDLTADDILGLAIREEVDAHMTGEHPSDKVLRRFDDFQPLPQDSLDMVSEKTWIRRAPADELLLPLGSTDPWIYYLMEGELLLKAADGEKHVVVGGTSDARYPIAFLVPRIYAVTSATQVKYLRVHEALVYRVRAQNGLAWELPEDVDKNSYAHDKRLLSEIRVDLKTNRLQLPSQPGVAGHVRGILEQTRGSVDGLCRAADLDPVITAKLIRAANYKSSKKSGPVYNSRQAIKVLGAKAARKVINGAVEKEIFTSDSPLLQARMRQFWLHSAEVAAICHLFGRVTPGFDAARAFAGGFLHNIGVVPILCYADRYPNLARNPQQLAAITNRLAGPIGEMLLEEWGLGEEVVTCAREANDWYRDTGDKPDYCDLVLLAKLHSYIGTPMTRTVPVMRDLPAFQKFTMGQISADETLDTLIQIRKRIRQVRQVLNH